MEATDPLCNTRRKAGMSSSEYYVFWKKRHHRDAGPVRNIFAAWTPRTLVSSKSAVCALDWSNEKINQAQSDGCEGIWECCGKTYFWIWGEGTVYNCDKCNYAYALSRNIIHHISMTEHTAHFWRFGLSTEQLEESTNYHMAPTYVSEFPPFANVPFGIPKLLFLKTLNDMDKALTVSGRRSMLRAEQKNLAIVRNIFRKFSHPAGLVLAPCLGAGATANASFVGTKKSKAYWLRCRPHLRRENDAISCRSNRRASSESRF